MTFHEAGFTPKDRQAAGIDVDSITGSCVQEARGDAGRTAGLAVSAAHRMLANLRSQKEGTADALGIAPTGPQKATDATTALSEKIPPTNGTGP